MALIIVFVLVNILGTNSNRTVFVDGDGRGHFAYLPSILIYHSVDFEDVFKIEKQNRPPDYMGHNYHKYGEILINKFSCGTALLQLPFFLMALLLSLLFGFPADGYNVIFQYSIAFAALFWVGLGISYFVRLLLTYKVERRFAWVIVVVGLFGTNLFFYTFIQPSFSHAYSFSLITIFLYFSRKVFLDYDKKSVLIAAFILGLIVLVRPVNIIIVAALPFIAETPQNFFNVVKKKFRGKHYLPTILLFIIAISPQLIINYLQTGSLLIYGYKNEGFYFTDPQLVNFLLSYRKGWFVYTPLFLLIFPSVIYLWRGQSKYAFFTFLAFLLVLVYIFSSWWNWYYGDSFGMRPMVDFYGLFLLVIALLLQNIKRVWLKAVTVLFISLVLMLNIIQSYQYAKGIIHPDSMSKKSYWYVFLKTANEYENVISGGDESFYGRLSVKPFFSSINKIDGFNEGWGTSNSLCNTIAFSDSLSVSQDQNNFYSPSFSFQVSDSLIGYKNIFVRFDSKYYELNPNSVSHAVFVVDIRDTSDKSIFYKTFPVKQIPDNNADTWQSGSIGFKLPEITIDMSYLKFYIWNVNKQNYFLDDLSIRLYVYHSD